MPTKRTIRQTRIVAANVNGEHGLIQLIGSLPVLGKTVHFRQYFQLRLDGLRTLKNKLGPVRKGTVISTDPLTIDRTPFMK